MSKFSSREKFIARSREIHGDKYDYSKVVYIGWDKKVIITCPFHGDFEQTPSHHTSGARGCPMCSNPSRPICGVGINDIYNVRGTKFYEIWHSMIYRCYGKAPRGRNDTYNDCLVCEEWLKLSNFKKWFENPENGYREGYHLDKDILSKGNKVYSPKTCCLIPPALNLCFTHHRKTNGLPLGVCLRKGKYVAQFSPKNKNGYLGRFNTVEEAFSAYKTTRESHIRNLANLYYQKGEITKRVYDALMRYEIKMNG